MIGGQRIDGEIAAGRVFLPIVGVSDGRAAPVGRDVAAQRRDFDRLPGTDRGDRAVVDPGRHGLDVGRLEPLDDLFGQQAGGEVDIVDFEAEQVVAHRAADQPRQPLGSAERIEQPRHARPRAPFFGVESQRHCSRRARLTMIAAVAPQILRPSQSIW